MTSKSVRAWTIYAAPAIIVRIQDIPGLSARVFPNAGCSIFPEVQTVESVERVVMVCDYPGGPIYSKKSVQDRVVWTPLGPGRSFMPSLVGRSTDKELRKPGFWAQVYLEAGDALVDYLKQRPKP